MEKITLTQAQLGQVQKLELELLLEVDRICRKHQLKYSLGYGTLLGAIRHGGFIPWDDDVDILMLREDYERFKVICQSELNRDKYFYQSQETDANYWYLFNKIRINQTVFKEAALAHHEIHHGLYLDIFPLDYLPAKKYQGVQIQLCRNILMAKYVNLQARTGVKKLAARLMRLVFWQSKLAKLAFKTQQLAQQCSHGEFVGVLGYPEVFSYREVTEVIDWEFSGYQLSVFKHYDQILTTTYGNYWAWPNEDERKTRHEVVKLKILF